jgi:hypothetical protein
MPGILKVAAASLSASGFFLNELGQPEVEHLNQAMRRQHDILRLDVAVDDPGFVGGA